MLSDISQAFATENATIFSYSNFLIRKFNLIDLTLLTETQCQLDCYFATDCHFVAIINSTLCVIGNFKITPSTQLNYNDPAVVFIYKGL
jgi:hypothetical protein